MKKYWKKPICIILNAHDLSSYIKAAALSNEGKCNSGPFR